MPNIISGQEVAYGGFSPKALSVKHGRYEVDIAVCGQGNSITGEVRYKDQMIWSSDSCVFAIILKLDKKKQLVFIRQVIVEIGLFKSFILYKSEDISEKVSLPGLPEINNFWRHGQTIFLEYYDYQTIQAGHFARSGYYLLKKEELTVGF